MLDELGLRRCDDHEPPDVMIRETKWPQSVFRAAVNRDGVLVADVLQCWLDVSNVEARGREQANHLWNQALAPHLELRRAK